MGFRDLLLFYLVTGFTVLWIATAAAGLTILLVAGGALVYYLGRRREHARR
jgi:hypothetical protein